MYISLLIWCYCFVVKSVFSSEFSLNSVDTVNHTYSDDKLLIKGHFVNTLVIKTLMSNRTIQKVYVYVMNTFSVDDNLEMRGIRELHILAKTWNISRSVTLDLSGLDGRNQAPSTVKGSAGNRGKSGMSGGNFFGLASEVVNGDFLRVKLNGGNGGDGQDGTASDDVYVTFNASITRGDSEWFIAADLHTYYQHYFKEKGYDPDISNIDDYTSLYTLLVHNKTANFKIRLHPLKCCGKTGMGGVGGQGGRSGTYYFVNVGPGNISGSPKFIAKEGWTGNAGSDAKPCLSTALDIRVATKLANVVFISVPLHHSFSSEFSYVGQLNSSKCPVEYVNHNEVVIESKQQKIGIVLAVIEYKSFLLKDKSVGKIIERTVHAIDLNSELNNEYTANDFVIEAIALEKRFLDLRKFVDFAQLYERLYERTQMLENRTYSYSRSSDYAPSTPLSLLKNIFMKRQLQLSVGEYLIFDIETYFQAHISYIKFAYERVDLHSNINDLELRTNIIKFQFNAHGNYLLSSYFTDVDSYKVAFFPFTAPYLGMYQLSPSLQSYRDLHEIVSATTNNYKSMLEHIPIINSDNYEVVMNKTSLNIDDPKQYFYKWKNSEVRNELRQLFAGEKIRLFADIKKSEKQLRKQFNAFQFNQINFVFRSSNKTMLNLLYEAIAKNFWIDLKHTGESDIRCNDDFYRITSGTLMLGYCPPQNGVDPIGCTTQTYSQLKYNRPFLSPYTLWEIQLRVDHGAHEPEDSVTFSSLAKFVDVVDLDLEMYCSGKYLKENASICNDSNLSKFYSLM